jgi:hypothetical protein
MRFLTTLLVVATAFCGTYALGNAIIYNTCPYDVYLWPTDVTRHPTTPQTIVSGSFYSEGFQALPDSGVSLKLSVTTDMTSNITQLEYTVNPNDGTNFVWYDGSNVNCAGENCPFYDTGMYLTTSISSCPTRTCPAMANCTGFYNKYNDDMNSLSCDDSANIMLYLCTTTPVSTIAVRGAQSTTSLYTSPTVSSSIEIAYTVSPSTLPVADSSSRLIRQQVSMRRADKTSCAPEASATRTTGR